MRLATLSRAILAGVGCGLLNVMQDVECVAGGLGNGEAVIKREPAGNTTKAEDDTPHGIHSLHALCIALARRLCGDEFVLEGLGHDQSHQCGGSLADTLHGEDSGNHGSTSFCTCKLGGNDCAGRVVASYTDSHHNPPEDE